MLITSPVNSKLKHARQVRDGRVPEEIFIEGERLSEECLNTELPLIAAFHAPSPSMRAKAIIAELERRNCPVYETVADALETVTDTVNSQGLVIIAARPDWNVETIFSLSDAPNSKPALFICLDAVQDPGNCGTLLRTAEGAGVQGVLALNGTTDIFAPKTLRSAMGAAFRLPIATGLDLSQVIAACRERQIKVVATASSALLLYSDYNWSQPTMVIFGNEAQGISAEAMAECDMQVRIPLRYPVESLNVAAAAAITLFEAARQRGFN